MKKIISLLIFLLVLAGCSSTTPNPITSGIIERVETRVVKDLETTSRLAEAYGKPDVKVCSDFLLTTLNSEDSTVAKIQALMKEDTDGLLSSALKSALLAEMVRSFNDPAQRAKFEADFRANCEKVAGAIMMNVLRDARTVGSRGLVR